MAGVLDLSKDPGNDLEVVRDVLRYFVRNPEAADTIEGVARWRLLDQKIHDNLREVTRAIAWLVANGLLAEDRLPASFGRTDEDVQSRPKAHTQEEQKLVRSVFRLNKEAMRQIEHFLQPKTLKGKKRVESEIGQPAERNTKSLGFSATWRSRSMTRLRCIFRRSIS
jgi:hypothetical protein